MVQGCDPWSPKALRSGMGATFKAALVSEAARWEGAFRMRSLGHIGAGVCVCACLSYVLCYHTHPNPHLHPHFHKTHTEAKAALAARHGAALQFVAADGGEGLADYDAIDWTGGCRLALVCLSVSCVYVWGNKIDWGHLHTKNQSPALTPPIIIHPPQKPNPFQAPPFSWSGTRAAA